MSKSREDIISEIKRKFPLSGVNASVLQINRLSLMQAVFESNWEDLPTEVLELYLEFVKQEQADAREAYYMWILENTSPIGGIQ